MSRNAFNVGDPVVIDRGNGGIDHTFVVKVARKYFTVGTKSWHVPAEFEIATGRERVKNPQYPQYYTDRAYTPEQWEQKAARDGLRSRLNEHDARGSYSALKVDIQSMTDLELVELLALLDRVKARKQSEEGGL